jgi:hypothetical protein
MNRYSPFDDRIIAAAWAGLALDVANPPELVG